MKQITLISIGVMSILAGLTGGAYLLLVSLQNASFAVGANQADSQFSATVFFWLAIAIPIVCIGTGIYLFWRSSRYDDVN